MSNVNLILAFAVGLETPTLLAAIYFLKHKVTVPTPVSPAVTVSKAMKIIAQTITVNPTQPIVKCSKCGHNVARYTATVAGPVCANCQPMK